MFKPGFKPDPNANQYEAFDPSTHIKAGFQLVDIGDADLRKYSVKVYNQLQTSTCVSWAMRSALEIKNCVNHGIENFVELSTLDIYYGSRDLEDPKTTDKDEGSYVTLAAESLKRFGVCREVMWPFKQENIYLPPSIISDRESYLNKIDGHFRIASSGRDRVNDIITNLQVLNPIVLGTSVDQQMWAPANANSPPLTTPSRVDGMHGICIVGYDPEEDCFYFKNSWGNFWFLNGYGKIKADVIGDPELTKDVWCLIHSSDAWFEGKK